MLQGIIIMYMASQHMIHPVLDYTGEDVAKGLQVIQIHIYIYIDVYIYVHIYTYVCVHVYIYVYIHGQGYC